MIFPGNDIGDRVFPLRPLVTVLSSNFYKQRVLNCLQAKRLLVGKRVQQARVMKQVLRVESRWTAWWRGSASSLTLAGSDSRIGR